MLWGAPAQGQAAKHDGYFQNCTKRSLWIYMNGRRYRRLRPHQRLLARVYAGRWRVEFRGPRRRRVIYQTRVNIFEDGWHVRYGCTSAGANRGRFRNCSSKKLQVYVDGTLFVVVPPKSERWFKMSGTHTVRLKPVGSKGMGLSNRVVFSKNWTVWWGCTSKKSKRFTCPKGYYKASKKERFCCPKGTKYLGNRRCGNYVRRFKRRRRAQTCPEGTFRARKGLCCPNGTVYRKGKCMRK